MADICWDYCLFLFKAIALRIVLFDVALEPVKRDDLELIRYWRNSDKIRKRMEYRENISAEQQLKWFNEFSDYKTASAYIIVYQGKKIGLIYDKNTNDYSEGGMFIWEDEYLGSLVPVCVSLLKTDTNFHLIRNKYAFIKILSDNERTIAFNTQLGYKLCEGQEGKYNQLYRLTLEDYELKAARFKKMLEIYYQTKYEVQFYLDKSDVESGYVAYYLEHYVKDNTGNFRLIFPTGEGQ